MRLPVNKFNVEHGVGKKSHLVDRQEIHLYHGSSVRRDHFGRKYKRALMTFHDIQSYYWSADNDNGREHADKASSSFRGYETVEF